MKSNNIEKLYHKIINSHNKTVKNYLKFLIKSSMELSSNKEKQVQLIDKTIKKMLLELKSTVDYNLYDQVIINMGENNNQDGFDFAIGLIKTYYQNEFLINGYEYSVFDIMINIYNEYKTDTTLPIMETIHYTLASFFKIHYLLYYNK